MPTRLNSILLAGQSDVHMPVHIGCGGYEINEWICVDTGKDPVEYTKRLKDLLKDWQRGWIGLVGASSSTVLGPSARDMFIFQKYGDNFEDFFMWKVGVWTANGSALTLDQVRNVGFARLVEGDTHALLGSTPLSHVSALFYPDSPNRTTAERAFDLAIDGTRWR